MTEDRPDTLSAGLRDRLRRLADVLIPAAHGMPGAGEAGVAGELLDRVLAARPDLLAPLQRALERTGGEPGLAGVAELEGLDPEAHQALVTTVAGGYYMDPGVRRRLGYDGQVPRVVRLEETPAYEREGLLDPVRARGAIYRTIADEEVASG